ncbi:hypothetical protein HELRODRAFT_178707 [Helobdella robusta]|uniref:Uncharacterized protein n=1 Tax=Helobdella robusta TaxID=6412 RepID=T1FDL7_HELRO|nr:hypothetical protein HELRODRAFT_178707 [Helobdella robusta]ESN96907.1 hypothetical protein HELRODRAFT_178707 [Helobdella robusta]
MMCPVELKNYNSANKSECEVSQTLRIISVHFFNFSNLFNIKFSNVDLYKLVRLIVHLIALFKNVLDKQSSKNLLEKDALRGSATFAEKVNSGQHVENCFQETDPTSGRYDAEGTKENMVEVDRCFLNKISRDCEIKFSKVYILLCLAKRPLTHFYNPTTVFESFFSKIVPMWNDISLRLANISR